MTNERIINIGLLAYRAIVQLGFWLLVIAGASLWIVRGVTRFVALPTQVGRSWRKPSALQETSSRITAAIVDTALVSVPLLFIVAWVW